MANGRNKRSKVDLGRDSGGFVAVPWSVLDCPAYARLSHPARSLLMEIARQWVRDNNGRLLASKAYLSRRGWKSADVITRAKLELLESGFIHETVKGHRPNKASWYAVTWRALDRLPGYDVGAAETFLRGAYKQNMLLKNASLRPSRGLEGLSVAPSNGLERMLPTPSHGAIKAVFPQPPTPSHGNHLDMPSTAVEVWHGSYKRLTATPTGLFTSLIDWHPISMNDGEPIGAAETKVALGPDRTVRVMSEDDDIHLIDAAPPNDRYIDRDDFGRGFDIEDSCIEGGDPFASYDQAEVAPWQD